MDRADDMDLAAAFEGLAALVRAEYPVGYSLGEIAETWGVGEGLTAEQVEAIKRYESARIVRAY